MFKMKDLVTKPQQSIKADGAYMLRAVFLHACMAILGFIATKAVIFESLMPFGLIFAGGCSAVFLPSVCVGAFIGYFIPAIGVGGFRYIAALLAVLAIRLLVSNYKKIAEHPLFLSAVCAAANLVTGGVTYSGVPLDALKLTAECLIVFCITFVVSRTFITLGRNYYGLSSEELSYLLITSTIILMGLSSFTPLGLSLGNTAGVFLILAAAKYGGTLASSVSGIALSFACALTDSYEGGFGIYALAGLAAGSVISLGKYAQTLAVAATGIIGLSFMQFKDGSAAFMAEIVAGSIIFLILPRSVGIFLGKIFYCYPRVSITDGYNKALTMRLDLAASALRDVSETVSQVSRELSRINAPDFNSTLALIEQDACAGCKLRLHCWENRKEDTLSAVMQMIASIKEGKPAHETAAGEEFQGRCLRVKKMEDSVNRRYSEFASRLAAENRIEEVRSVVSDQFEGVSNMLLELSLDFQNDDKFDNCAATAAAAALKNIGVCAEESCAKIDKFGRMSVEIKVKKDNDAVLSRLQIMKILSLSCERDFDVPNISTIGDSILITAHEHAALKIDVGVQQLSASGGSMCGDSCRYFNDGKGHFVMVLSDGMGTGGRAAVDGAMASGLMSRLLKAGFGYDCSLKILNSSMLFKSTDESLATVDIASVDLFTGNVELYKAGAAPTLVRRNGKTGKAESTSLPIGILRDVSFDRAGIKLRAGDVLLLLSDGATFEGTEWIKAELQSWGEGSAQNLAEHIAECARRRRTDRKEDDISVMAAIIEKAI